MENQASKPGDKSEAILNQYLPFLDAFTKEVPKTDGQQYYEKDNNIKNSS